MIGLSGFVASVKSIGIRVVSAATTKGLIVLELCDVRFGRLLSLVLWCLVAHVETPETHLLYS